ncbi:MAG: hypothetical protein MJ234_02550 [bacterium]|nr:hypothetical protein [bacterium]
MNNSQSDLTLNAFTGELVKEKMEMSYTRIRELYNLKQIEIEKMEEKIVKLTDKLSDLKADRQQFEDELNGLYESYVTYCRETGFKPAFEL